MRYEERDAAQGWHPGTEQSARGLLAMAVSGWTSWWEYSRTGALGPEEYNDDY